jgi:cytosine deaminase
MAGGSAAPGTLHAWSPASLFDQTGLGDVRRDGLVAIEIAWRDGVISALRALPSGAAPPTELLLPRLVEPHAHLDKAFTWADHPNHEGTYAGALAANRQEHSTRSVERVVARAERGLQLAWRHGLRGMRSHIDSLGPGAACSWEALQDRRQLWRERIELQLVALVPISHWSTPEADVLARQVVAAGGLLGGVLVPPCRDAQTRRGLEDLLALADRLGCGIDLHIDEADQDPAAGLRLLVHCLDRRPVSVPITCSHASSLALLSARALARLADRMAAHRLGVVALPLTNGWLLGRRPQQTPLQRPLAPLLQLQRAGVVVAVGGDNVQDPWFPGGSFDPIALMAASLPLAQLAPWQRRGLMPFTTEAARLLGLAWDGRLQVGAPADLILLEATHWGEVLASPPRRRVLVAGRWLTETGADHNTAASGS